MNTEREQFLKDMLITAVEGGINYWSSVSEYHPDAGTVVVWERVDELDEDADKPYLVNTVTIAGGLEWLKKNAPRTYEVDGLNVADRTNGAAGDFDANSADAVMQAALFGELVYG